MHIYYCQTKHHQQGLIMLEKSLLPWDNISKSPRLTFLFPWKEETVSHPVNVYHDGKALHLGGDRECASRCTAIHFWFTPTPNAYAYFSALLLIWYNICNKMRMSASSWLHCDTSLKSVDVSFITAFSFCYNNLVAFDTRYTIRN